MVLYVLNKKQALKLPFDNTAGDDYKESTRIAWAREMAITARQVGHYADRNGVIVSTVFLGMDHAWGNNPPLLFETMVFGGRKDRYQDRYSTWEEAQVGHERAVKMVKLAAKEAL